MQFIINNRNLYTWTKDIVDNLHKFSLIDDVIIIDNGSTYEPLLEWYDTNPCTIIKERNLGHTALWNIDLIDKIDIPYIYIQTRTLGFETCHSIRLKFYWIS
jgi:glycosyltransferase involved in cell wall biosynthesis